MPPRVLLLCYHFFPSREVGAARSNALTKYLQANGVPPTVVSEFSGMPLDSLRDLMDKEFRGLDIFAVKESEGSLVALLVELKRRLTSSPATGSVETKGPAKKTSAQSAGIASLYQTLKSWFFAVFHAIDDKKGWAIHAAGVAAAAARDHKSELIFASGPPISSLAAAVIAGKRAGIPVIIDFRDPCYFNEPQSKTSLLSRLDASLRLGLESWLVRHASAVVCTAPSLSDALQTRYPGIASKIHYIPNGYDIEPAPPFPTDHKLTIVFAGALYLNRDPFEFLRAVSGLLEDPHIEEQRISVTFVGQCDTHAGQDLREWLSMNAAGRVTRVLPPVGREELQHLYGNATVLLNLAQGQPMQIPAKTFEQLASGKELLLVCEAHSDTARIVKDLPGVHRVDGHDGPAMLAILRDLYFRHVVQGISNAPRKEDIERFSRLEQNLRLTKLLETCVRDFRIRP